MVISKSTFNILSYGSLTIVALFIVLIYTHIAPQETFLYLLIISIFLLVGRIFLRIYYIKQNKNNYGG
ncbi:MAG: hypothetical protein M1480_10230 [Bacteroidetes bacterium]|nr:hypothetical protein [Bacteroidota bacterium]